MVSIKDRQTIVQGPNSALPVLVNSILLEYGPAHLFT